MAAQTRVSWRSTHIYVSVPPVLFRGTSVSPLWSSHDTLQHFLPLASWGKQLIEDRLVMYTLWNRFRSGFWTPRNARIWDPTARWPPRQTCLSLCRRAAGGPEARDEMSRGLHVKSAEGGFLNVRGLRCVRFHIKSGIKIGYNDTWLRKKTWWI